MKILMAYKILVETVFNVRIPFPKPLSTVSVLITSPLTMVISKKKLKQVKTDDKNINREP